MMFADGGSNVFATFASVVVGRIGQAVLHSRVQQNEFIAFGGEIEVLVFQGTTV